MISASLYYDILELANGVAVNDNNYIIASHIIHHGMNIQHISLEQFSLETHVSINQINKFCKQFGVKGFSQLKQNIKFWLDYRIEQNKERFENVQLDKIGQQLFPLTSYESFEEFYHQDLLEQLCREIKTHRRIVVYGSTALLNMMLDFQIDMMIMGKEVILNNMTKENYPIQEDDLIALVSMSGRSFLMTPPQFKESVLNHHQLILNICLREGNTNAKIQLPIYTKKDCFEAHYIFLYYLDLIKTMYYRTEYTQ